MSEMAYRTRDEQDRQQLYAKIKDLQVQVADVQRENEQLKAELKQLSDWTDGLIKETARLQNVEVRLDTARAWSARWKKLAQFRGWPASKHGRIRRRLTKAEAEIERRNDLYQEALRAWEIEIRERQQAEAREAKLRELLWEMHPCVGKYGDDGEMQCSCGCDFRRDTVEEIERKTVEMNLRKLALAASPEPKEESRG